MKTDIVVYGETGALMRLAGHTIWAFGSTPGMSGGFSFDILDLCWEIDQHLNFRVTVGVVTMSL